MEETVAESAGASGPEKKWKIIGPGLVAAATGVGAGDLVATLVAGSKYGYALLWAAVIGCIMKIILVEGTGRYCLATGRTIFEGWRSLGKWTTWYFAPYILIWGLIYGAAAMSSSALPLVALFPEIDLKLFAIGSGLLGLLFVWFGGYAFFEKVIAVFVGMMFFTVVGAAIITLPNLGELVKGLVPVIPEDGGLFYVMGLAGGVGGTITLAAYGYWLKEKGWSDSSWMRIMRLDNSVAYIFTGVFVVSMLIVGAELLYSANIAVSQGDKGLLDLANVLGARYGTLVSKIFLIGFWASSFSSLIGVWNGVSLMFADFLATILKIPKNDPAVRSGGRYFKYYALWLTFPSMALLFLNKPVGLIITYGVLGSLFMPFLAITLLWLLNKKEMGEEWKNSLARNVFLTLCASLFIALGAKELIGFFL